MLGLSIDRASSAVSRFPADSPLALSFVDQLYLMGGAYVSAPAAFTVTRSTTKLAQDGAGHWHSFGPDVAAITNLGLLLEPSATNVLRNASAQGAVAGSPGTFPTYWGRFAGGGPTLSVAGHGTEAGLPYVDVRLSGFATAVSGAAIHFEQTNAAAAVQGETWTGSAFVRLVGGSLSGLSTVRLNIQESNSGGSGTNTNYGTDVRNQMSDQWLRIQEVSELSAATTNFVRVSLELAYTAGAAIDVTLRVSCPQLENGSVATSPILSTTTAQMRAADQIHLELPTFPCVVELTYGSAVQQTLSADGGLLALEAEDLLRYDIAEIFATYQ